MLAPRQWLRALCLALWLSGAHAQGRPLSEGEVPPGLRQWLGRDNCGAEPWPAFHAGLASAIAQINERQFAPAMASVVSLLIPVVQNPHVAFDCATAVSSALILAAQCGEQLQLTILAGRLRQLGAIFASFDYQMKGEEYIDQSPWPINWMNSMEGILRAMTMMKQYEMQAEPARSVPLRKALAESGLAGVSRNRIAIVTVCDYDAGITPLARLSQLNKESYAQRHGYDAFVYEKAPVYQDPLTPLLTEPASHRPAAWSKIDAVLTVMAGGEHDWVMWMDCDSFFMDPEVRLEELIAVAESVQCGAVQQAPSEGDDLSELRALVQQWQDGPPSSEADLPWYEELLEAQWQKDVLRVGAASDCVVGEPADEPPRNLTLGWADWLFLEKRPHMLASEDGLMLNTGNMLLRASPWSWRLLQQVRWMTFGQSPVTQHPWWEQTALVYLLQLPLTLAHAAGVAASQAVGDIGPTSVHRGYARAMFMFGQKHMNGYPPIVASALQTHETFDVDDFIVSFSGCKVYSSQEVCNQLFLSYFFQVHDVQQLQTDPALQPWL